MTVEKLCERLAVFFRVKAAVRMIPVLVQDQLGPVLAADLFYPLIEQCRVLVRHYPVLYAVQYQNGSGKAYYTVIKDRNKE